MAEFQYREIDEQGLGTLDVIAAADKFNQWMYETIRPFCNGEVIEIGSGIGNISQFFIRDNYNITLSDIRQNYCAALEQKFGQKKNYQGSVLLDLTHPEFDIQYKEFLEKFDTFFALNVVEHIKDDEQAMINARKLLKKNGNIIILVPAYQMLYNGFDKELEHYRRYSMKTLATLVGKYFSIIHKQYFNCAGIPGWFISGKLQKNKTIPAGQMKLYNQLVPLFKLADRVLFNKIGLSVICIGKKE